MWAPLQLTSAVTALSGQPLTQANTLRMLCSRAGSTSTRNWPYLENGVYTLSSLLPRRQPSFVMKHKSQNNGYYHWSGSLLSLPKKRSSYSLVPRPCPAFHHYWYCKRRKAGRGLGTRLVRVCTDLFILKASTAATHVGSMVGRMK